MIVSAFISAHALAKQRQRDQNKTGRHKTSWLIGLFTPLEFAEWRKKKKGLLVRMTVKTIWEDSTYGMLKKSPNICVVTCVLR